MGSVCTKSICPCDTVHWRRARKGRPGTFLERRLHCSVIPPFDVLDAAGCVCDTALNSAARQRQWPDVIFLEQFEWRAPPYYLVYQRGECGELPDCAGLLEIPNRYLANVRILHRLCPVHRAGHYMCAGWTPDPLMLAAVAEVKFRSLGFAINR